MLLKFTVKKNNIILYLDLSLCNLLNFYSSFDNWPCAFLKFILEIFVVNWDMFFIIFLT